jgi:hypothetical protein
MNGILFIFSYSGCSHFLLIVFRNALYVSQNLFLVEFAHVQSFLSDRNVLTSSGSVMLHCLATLFSSLILPSIVSGVLPAFLCSIRKFVIKLFTWAGSPVFVVYLRKPA